MISGVEPSRHRPRRSAWAASRFVGGRRVRSELARRRHSYAGCGMIELWQHTATDPYVWSLGVRSRSSSDCWRARLARVRKNAFRTARRSFNSMAATTPPISLRRRFLTARSALWYSPSPMTDRRPVHRVVGRLWRAIRACRSALSSARSTASTRRRGSQLPSKVASFASAPELGPSSVPQVRLAACTARGRLERGIIFRWRTALSSQSAWGQLRWRVHHCWAVPILPATSNACLQVTQASAQNATEAGCRTARPG